MFCTYYISVCDIIELSCNRRVALVIAVLQGIVTCYCSNLDIALQLVITVRSDIYSCCAGDDHLLVTYKYIYKVQILLVITEQEFIFYLLHMWPRLSFISCTWA